MRGALTQKAVLTMLPRPILLALTIFLSASHCFGIQAPNLCPRRTSELALISQDSTDDLSRCSNGRLSSDGKVVLPAHILKLKARHAAHPRNKTVSRQLGAALHKLAIDLLDINCGDDVLVAKASLDTARTAAAVDPGNAAAAETVRSLERLVADLQVNDVHATPDGVVVDGSQTIGTPIPRAPLDNEKPPPPK